MLWITVMINLSINNLSIIPLIIKWNLHLMVKETRRKLCWLKIFQWITDKKDTQVKKALNIMTATFKEVNLSLILRIPMWFQQPL